MYKLKKELKEQLVNYLAQSILPAKDAFYFISELNKLPELTEKPIDEK